MRFWGFVLLLLLVLSNPLVAKESYYGKVDAGVRIRVESDEAGGIYLQVFYSEGQGHYQSLLQPLRMEPTGTSDLDYEATGLVQGVSVPIRVSLAADGVNLKWMLPTQLKLAKGSFVDLSGSYRQLSLAERRADAERCFKVADQGLNEAYHELRSRLKAEDFNELRSNQRRWLKYRDHSIVDDDDTSAHGPGSIPFLHVKTTRTLERTAFLQALVKPLSGGNISGRYSDGIDWDLRLNEATSSGHHLFYTFTYSLGDSQGSEWSEPMVISGCALPRGNGQSWIIPLSNNKRAAERDTDSALLLEPADDGESVLVSRSIQAPFTARLYRIAELTPADEPMPKILLRMPVKIFDNTTEGLSEEEKTQLLLTGTSGPFQLQEPGKNFIQVRYSEGEVDLRRFPAVDGNGVVAVSTTNGRARTFELWLLTKGNDIPVLWPKTLAFPHPSIKDFFANPTAMATMAEGVLDFSLHKDIADIHVNWMGPADTPEADFSVDLVWDGYGFGVVRSAVMK